MIAYLTAGAGGMYCGSCMHDNTLVRAWTQMGVDAQLIPTYTPIRTDEENVSVDRVFFSGINIYLEQLLPFYRFVPSFVRGVFDQPWLIRWAASRPSAVRPKSLGALTVSMLRGAEGKQRVEVEKLCRWLVGLQPHLVLFTNVLIAGCAQRLKAELGVPLVVTLQGDDAFLEYLTEPYRSQAIEEIRRLVVQIDGFLVHSRYYADFMQEYLGIPPGKIHQVPLGVDVRGFPAPSEATLAGMAPGDRTPAARTIGYLARLSPDKGLHLLVDAFLDLRLRSRTKGVRLRIAGWTGRDHRSYAEKQLARMEAAGLAGAFEYVGAVDRHQKLEFLRDIDVLSVPTTYRDPKGLFVLESLAAGVPVVQPRHGAFPEMLARLGGGRLVPPNDPRRLADALESLLCDDVTRRKLGQEGARRVHAEYNAEVMAAKTWEVLQRF
ncbi:MAG: glycosyltransferase family 4 protein [Pirellulaceae bacterium]